MVIFEPEKEKSVDYSEYFATPKNPFKEGQKAWSSLFGDCKITAIGQNDRYPLSVQDADDCFYTFTAEGLHEESHKSPSLFHKKPPFFK